MLYHSGSGLLKTNFWNVFTGQMPFSLPNQQQRCMEANKQIFNDNNWRADSKALFDAVHTTWPSSSCSLLSGLATDWMVANASSVRFSLYSQYAFSNKSELYNKM